MVFGEVLYRLGSDVIDDRATGVERVGREIAGFLISPGRSFTRRLSENRCEKEAMKNSFFKKH
jgi:hypothetical protein